MECLNCESPMHRGAVPFDIERNGYQISWDMISAWVCDQCGETLFEAKEVAAIQETLATLDSESK